MSSVNFSVTRAGLEGQLLGVRAQLLGFRRCGGTLRIRKRPNVAKESKNMNLFAAVQYCEIENAVKFANCLKPKALTRGESVQKCADTCVLEKTCEFRSAQTCLTRQSTRRAPLQVTLQHEKPELEQRKSEMLQKEETLKLELATLEKNLLIQLAQSKGDILQNEELIQSLNETKASSQNISEALGESRRTARWLRFVKAGGCGVTEMDAQVVGYACQVCRMRNRLCPMYLPSSRSAVELVVCRGDHVGSGRSACSRTWTSSGRCTARSRRSAASSSS